jgi:hypothetical protein
MNPYEVAVTDTSTGEIQRVTVEAGSFTDAALAAAETPFVIWETG